MPPLRRVAWWRTLRDDVPRPFIAFAAADHRTAVRLYRAQNLIWAWLGVAAVLSALAYFARPSLGLVEVTDSQALDTLRVLLFAFGGVGIATGVWTIHRVLEVWGHVFFSSGAIMTAAATATLPGQQLISVMTVLGLAFASAYRVYFIIKWIGSGPDVPPSGD